MRSSMKSGRISPKAKLSPGHPVSWWVKQASLLVVLLAMTLLTREPDALDIRLGQRVYVDDGTCSQGQVKEVVGSKLTPSGVQITRKCVPKSSVRQ